MRRKRERERESGGRGSLDRLELSRGCSGRDGDAHWRLMEKRMPIVMKSSVLKLKREGVCG